ncbi:MerR family transcriptional regulator [Roseicyclus sp.]|uniref:MerR family transcriptional regulator n=1 Tax=Roseicyclus sp. TaxID=1914329 RepID=UPI003F6B59D2
MTKSSQAFRTIREVAEWLGVAAHVLRFWESKFSQIKPVKRAGGRRYYRPSDMELVGGIKVLLHDRGLTIRGVQRMIRENGIGAVAALSPPLTLSEADRDDPANDWIEDAAREAIPMVAEPVIHAPRQDAPPAPIAADLTPSPAPVAARVTASMQEHLTRLAALVATPAALTPDTRQALRASLVALHAKMRDQAPA